MTTEDYNDQVRRYADDLYRFAVHSCGDHASSQDAVQEAFVSLWEQRERVETHYCKQYLFRVVQRKLTDNWRHVQVVREAHAELATSTPQSHTPDEQYALQDALYQALTQLPERQRAILQLHDVEGFSHQEIADIMGLNYKQVQVTLFRARVAMREKLKINN